VQGENAVPRSASRHSRFGGIFEKRSKCRILYIAEKYPPQCVPNELFIKVGIPPPGMPLPAQPECGVVGRGVLYGLKYNVWIQ
jgi:hypothetical protein